MSTLAVQSERPLPQQITDLLKELHVLEHGHMPEPPSTHVGEDRRQEIRRELVRIVSLLGWRQSYPLRLWMYGRLSRWIQ